MSQVNSPLVKRDYLYDNMKAFLIISVVIGHFASGGFGINPDWLLDFKKFIYVYHMPVFMIVSGRFAKGRIDRDEWPKVFSKGIVPYLSCNILMLLVCCMVDDVYATKNFSFLYPLYGMWYMLNVAVYTMFTAKVKDKKWLFLGAMGVALAVGFADRILYGGFHRLVCYYPFFLFGYYTSGMKFGVTKKWWFRIFSLAAIGAIGIYFLKRGDFVNYNLLSMNKTFSEIAEIQKVSLLHVFLDAIGRYLIAFIMFFLILGITPSGKTFYSYIGKYSIYVYVLHLFIVIISRNLDGEYGLLKVIDTEWKLLLYLASTGIFAFVLALKPVRRATRMFLEPDFDLTRAMNKLLDREQ